MTTLEVVISTGSVVTAAATIVYIMHVARHAGRDRPHDPARVKRFVEAAPVEHLQSVLDK